MWLWLVEKFLYLCIYNLLSLQMKFLLQSAVGDKAVLFFHAQGSQGNVYSFLCFATDRDTLNHLPTPRINSKWTPATQYIFGFCA